MVVDTVNEKLCVNKLVATKKEILFIEGDMIVPDSKPDVLNTICTSGVACIYKKDVLEEKIRIDGNVNTYIMYLAEDGQDKIRGLCTSLDFSEIIQVPNCKEGMSCKTEIKVKAIECKVINGRKIGIKATLEVNINIYAKDEVEVISDIQSANEIQMLKEDLKVNSLVGMGETKIYAKDNIMIDNIDNLAEVLKADINIINKDVKISYNKILTKSEAQIKVMYLTEDGRIKGLTTQIPMVGFIDIENVTEGNMCDVNYEMKNFIIKPNQTEEHSIYIEIETEVIATVYEEKQINLIQDMYSPIENLEFNKKKIVTVMDKKNIIEMKQIREKINVEGLSDKEIVDVDIRTTIENENRMDTRIMYESNLEMSFMVLSQDGIIDTKFAKIPFGYTLEGIEDAENINCKTEMEVKNHDFIIQEGELITINIDLEMNSSLYKNANLNMIDQIQINGEREEEDYSIAIYIVKKGDSLWSIGKKFGSTVDEIARTNGIEDVNKINVGQKLFIPKSNNIGGSNLKSPIVNYV